jgi:hypothetical protein
MVVLSRALITLAVLPLALASTPALRPVKTRRSTHQSPQRRVSLSYQADNSSAVAQVEADMNLPTVKLEDISSLSSVSCSADSVIVIFNDTRTYEEIASSWPSSDFILLTNHLGTCDTESKRGVYHVTSTSLDTDSLTIIAATTATSFRELIEFLSVRFNSTSATSALQKRDWDTFTTFDSTWSGELVDFSDLEIDVYSSTVTGTVELSGGIDYNKSTAAVTSAYVEFDLSLTGDLDIQAFAKASYSTDAWDYTLSDISVSVINIDDIITIGPTLEVSLGVEFAVTGEANVTADVTVELSDGKVYLDFLESSGSYASGWTPTYTADANLTTEVDAELNPYVEVELSIGIDILDILGLSAGIEAKAEIVNEFSVDSDFSLSSSTGVALANGTGTCSNGYWYACDFVFEIIAFVTDLYSDTLYEVTVPIYETECIAF